MTVTQALLDRALRERREAIEERDRAYTIIVSAIPSLYRSWRDSPNPTAAPLNRLLLNAAIEWVTIHQREQGREPDDFSEYAQP